MPTLAGNRYHARAVAITGFLAMGLLFGAYDASWPGIKAATGASDTELGAALTGIGVAALPAMPVCGRMLDRYGRRAYVTALVLFALIAPVPALTGSVPTLVAGMLGLGLFSGGLDVAINHLASAVEADTGRRLMNTAHAMFSLGVLVASAVTGVARHAGAPVAAPMVVLAVATLVAALLSYRYLPALDLSERDGSERDRSQRDRSGHRPAGRPADAPGFRASTRLLLAVGAIGALGLVVESALETWSAVFVEDTLSASAAVAGLGPALFAGAMVAGRLGGHLIGRRIGDVGVMVCVGALAAPGAVVVATATHPAVALIGLVLGGAGVSMAVPTVYGFAGRYVPGPERGRAIGTVTTVAYLGTIAGPGLVGLIAGATSLRVAIGVLAGVALVVAASAPVVRERSPGSRAGASRGNRGS